MFSLLLATAFSPVASAEPPTPHSYQHPYKFSSDWHTPHLNSWKKALAPYVGRPGLRYLEVGVFQGRSFFWVLEEVANHPTSDLTALDINTGFIAYNLALSGAAERVELVEGRSQDTLRTLPTNSYDIIYIDGSHRGDDVLVDAVLAWPLLKAGGTMLSTITCGMCNPAY